MSAAEHACVLWLHFSGISASFDLSTQANVSEGLVSDSFLNSSAPLGNRRCRHWCRQCEKSFPECRLIKCMCVCVSGSGLSSLYHGLVFLFLHQ